MIYVFTVAATVPVAAEAPTFEEARQHLQAEVPAATTQEVRFLGGYETWDGVVAAHPTAHTLPLLPGEFEVTRDVDLLAQDALEQATLRFFRWPLTKAELEEHLRHVQEGTGIYAPGTPQTLTFASPEEERSWLEEQHNIEEGQDGESEEGQLPLFPSS